MPTTNLGRIRDNITGINPIDVGPNQSTYAVLTETHNSGTGVGTFTVRHGQQVNVSLKYSDAADIVTALQTLPITTAAQVVGFYEQSSVYGWQELSVSYVFSGVAPSFDGFSDLTNVFFHGPDGTSFSPSESNPVIIIYMADEVAESTDVFYGKKFLGTFGTGNLAFAAAKTYWEGNGEAKECYASIQNSAYIYMFKSNPSSADEIIVLARNGVERATYANNAWTTESIPSTVTTLLKTALDSLADDTARVAFIRKHIRNGKTRFFYDDGELTHVLSPYSYGEASVEQIMLGWIDYDTADPTLHKTVVLDNEHSVSYATWSQSAGASHVYITYENGTL